MKQQFKIKPVVRTLNIAGTKGPDKYWVYEVWNGKQMVKRFCSAGDAKRWVADTKRMAAAFAAVPD